MLLEKTPVMSLPRKRKTRRFLCILQAVTARPRKVKRTLKINAFFLPCRSAYSPKIGAPRNCPREKAIKKNPRIAVLVSGEKSEENILLSVSRK